MREQIEALKALAQKHPVCIPVRAAANFMGASEDGLRASMDQGICPFGYGWQLGEKRAYKIPTLAFVAWMTKGAIPLHF